MLSYVMLYSYVSVGDQFPDNLNNVNEPLDLMEFAINCESNRIERKQDILSTDISSTAISSTNQRVYKYINRSFGV